MEKRYYCLMGDADLSMRLHKLLSREKIKNTLAPTPREADHCCGVCILYYNKEDRARIKDLALREGIEIDQFYESEKIEDPNRFKFC